MPRPPSADGYPTLCLALLADGPAHGYDLVKRLSERTEGDMRLPAGLVYPILHGLEHDGLIEAVWDRGGQGRRQRVYGPTVRGQQVLAARATEWERHRRAVDRLLLPHVGREAAAGA